MMPSWLWSLVFAALFLLGAVILVYLLLKLSSKAKRVKESLQIVTSHLDTLKQASETRLDYQTPKNNLADDPVTTTQIWLKRRNATERRKAEQQRRLVKRLTNRK